LDTQQFPICVCVAPSYSGFLDISYGRGVDWGGRHVGQIPPLRELLEAAQDLVGSRVDVIAVDMPLATVPITGRRTADNEVSARFSKNWCSAHSPSTTRPGPISSEFTPAAEALGYSLATADTPAGTVPRLLEVYPHPALLDLMERDRRIEYKVGKARKYWPDSPPPIRRSRIARNLTTIEDHLAGQLGSLPLPELPSEPSTRELKTREDAVDAIVSAWVGLRYFNREAVPFGDSTAAVWCPANKADK
jgi:predicted RNase H-like nuclease